jgi:uncharacterized protein (DUF4415 family)
MSKKKDDAASRPDDENPEWTRKEIRRARPVQNVIAKVFGTRTAEKFRRGRGRPEKANRKINQTLRLDPDVLAAYRHQGSGWQTRINEVLREHMPKQGK